ncbi:MAG: LptF/LptG family permease [Puniceicoccales bacterium]|nr:LptF/LptG family permease [Puniceicoccales bacterium]
MGIFFKYIAGETAIACCTAVALFVAILVSGNTVKDIFEWIASGRISVLESIRIIMIVLPSIVSYALPLGVLTGILVTIGRMSSFNEIFAMKSGGMSLYKISLPIFLFAAFATALSCLINLYYAPNAINEYRASFRNILRNNPIRFIRAREFIDRFPGYVLYIESIDGSKLSNFKIWQLSATNAVDVYITAESGTISYDEKSNALALTLENGSAERFSGENDEIGKNFSKIVFFGELSIALPVNGIISEQGLIEKKLRHMNIIELLQARKHWHSNGNIPLTEAIIRHDLCLVDMHISSNIAMSCGVFILSLVAIPLGIRTRRSDTSVNVIIAIILALGYHFSMVILSWFGDETSLHPEILVWLPNILLATLGIGMLRKCARF